jgi:hypothetical protein
MLEFPGVVLNWQETIFKVIVVSMLGTVLIIDY